MMNTMMEALKKSRKDGEVSIGSHETNTGNQLVAHATGNPGEMMSQKMASLESKLDQILKLLSGNKPADEAKENEPNGNGNGY